MAIDNKHQPAFPINEETTDRIDTGTRIYTGVSKLEFFACNAPVEIPGWFVHIPLKREQVLPPQLTSIANEDLRKQAKDWIHDPIYDLPQELDWFQDEYKTYWDSKRSSAIADEQARYFQWRRYYAEQLLLELSKPQP